MRTKENGVKKTKKGFSGKQESGVIKIKKKSIAKQGRGAKLKIRTTLDTQNVNANHALRCFWDGDILIDSAPESAWELFILRFIHIIIKIAIRKPTPRIIRIVDMIKKYPNIGL